MVDQKTDQISEKEDDKTIKYGILLLFMSIIISGYLLYKTIENQHIYKFGFITIKNKPEFKFNNTINMFILYDTYNSKNNKIYGESTTKIWVFLLYNFKDAKLFNIEKNGCDIIHKKINNVSTETKTREYCLNIMKNTSYSVIIIPDKKSYILIDNNKKQFIAHINKENPEEIQNIAIFLKDLILGKFKF